MDKVGKMESSTQIIRSPLKILPNADGERRVYIRCPHCDYRMLIGGDRIERRCIACNKIFYLDGVEIEEDEKICKVCGDITYNSDEICNDCKTSVIR